VYHLYVCSVTLDSSEQWFFARIPCRVSPVQVVPGSVPSFVPWLFPARPSEEKKSVTSTLNNSPSRFSVSATRHKSCVWHHITDSRKDSKLTVRKIGILEYVLQTQSLLPLL
jgi:hypothetical protein